MEIPAGEELIRILRNIKSEGKTSDEWAAIESDDMFQSENFTGGFDADESAFCFSYFASDGCEYWFQLTLSDIDRILLGADLRVVGRPAVR